MTSAVGSRVSDMCRRQRLVYFIVCCLSLSCRRPTT